MGGEFRRSQDYTGLLEVIYIGQGAFMAVRFEEVEYRVNGMLEGVEMWSQKQEAWSSFLASVGKSTPRQSVVASLAFTVPLGTNVFSI